MMKANEPSLALRFYEEMENPVRSESHLSIFRWQPTDGDQWSAMTQQLDQANVAHAPEWFAAIQSAYGHSPLYLQAEDGRGQAAILPAFFIRSRLFGSVVTSMPFLDTGGPCSSSQALAHALVGSLVEEAKRLGASRVELRCTQAMDLSGPGNLEKMNLVLPLPNNPDSLWKQFDAKVRNQIRKAERSGLSVEFGGKEKLSEFYKVFIVNMRDLGSPVHAQGFFQAILGAFGGSARIAIVYKDALPIGGLVALAFKDTIVVPWASSLREYFSLCPNMLLYWETIRTACMEGFGKFDFGRSSRDSNTYRFKRQWGALEEQLYWYTIPIDARSSENHSEDDRRKAIFAQVWQRLPLSVTRWVGPRLRKYITL